MMDSRQLARNKVKDIVRLFFKNDAGNPFEMTDGQADIFLMIFTRQFPRNQIIALTQYGKSEIVAMSLIMRSTTFNEKWAIVSGSMDKSMIIMSKVIQHCFDHPRFLDLLDIDAGTPLDRLRRERSRDNMTFKGGGGIKAFTANTKNRLAVKEALTGFGSQNIIEDEASLVPDDVQAMILRMLGGHADNFLLKIGNPFIRNHFLKTWQSSRYQKLFIDYKQALAEGRVTQEFIEEMQDEPFFDVLYECKFPTRDSYVTGGYKPLISDELLAQAWISEAEAQPLMKGRCRLGGDFAGGGNDRSAYVARWPKVMKLISTNTISDTMQQIPIIEDIVKSLRAMEGVTLDDADIAFDYGGLGQGIGDRYKEKGHEINTVMFGESAPESKKYRNMRAYMYYRFFKWLRKGGRIVRDDSFLELLSVNYKSDSERKLIIQPKEELKKIMKDMGIKVNSPDVADGGALTFANNSTIIGVDDFSFV